jgi:hypothetical protein
MRRVRIGVIVLVLLGLVACTQNIQEQWNALTPSEQARVILNQAQDDLSDNFRIAKDYITARPQYDAVWKAEIVPAFDLANKAIKAGLNLAVVGDITPDKVYAEIMPLVKQVLTKLVQIGAIKP